MQVVSQVADESETPPTWELSTGATVSLHSGGVTAGRGPMYVSKQVLSEHPAIIIIIMTVVRSAQTLFLNLTLNCKI